MKNAQKSQEEREMLGAGGAKLISSYTAFKDWRERQTLKLSTGYCTDINVIKHAN